MTDQEHATVRELANRYGVTEAAVRQSLRRPGAPKAVAESRPARYRVADMDAFRGIVAVDRATGVRFRSELPDGMAVVSQLSRMLGKDRATISKHLRTDPVAPTPAGQVRVGGRGPVLTDYYSIEEIRRWWDSANRHASHNAWGARLNPRPAHGTEGRYKRLACRCPVCQSARAAARDRLRGAGDRVTLAADRLVRVALDPAVPLERMAMIGEALGHPLRLAILRTVASVWPDAVPVVAVERHLGRAYIRADHWDLLVRAGLLERVDDPTRRAGRSETYRFVRHSRDRHPTT